MYNLTAPPINPSAANSGIAAGVRPYGVPMAGPAQQVGYDPASPMSPNPNPALNMNAGLAQFAEGGSVRGFNGEFNSYVGDPAQLAWGGYGDQAWAQQAASDAQWGDYLNSLASQADPSYLSGLRNDTFLDSLASNYGSATDPTTSTSVYPSLTNSIDEILVNQRVNQPITDIGGTFGNANIFSNVMSRGGLGGYMGEPSSYVDISAMPGGLAYNQWMREQWEQQVNEAVNAEASKQATEVVKQLEEKGVKPGSGFGESLKNALVSPLKNLFFSGKSPGAIAGKIVGALLGGVTENPIIAAAGAKGGEWLGGQLGDLISKFFSSGADKSDDAGGKFLDDIARNYGNIFSNDSLQPIFDRTGSSNLSSVLTDTAVGGPSAGGGYQGEGAGGTANPDTTTTPAKKSYAWKPVELPKFPEYYKAPMGKPEVDTSSGMSFMKFSPDVYRDYLARSRQLEKTGIGAIGNQILPGESAPGRQMTDEEREALRNAMTSALSGARFMASGGLASLPEYRAGGKAIRGSGDGVSDSVPAVINGAQGKQRAALSDGEFVIPARVVAELGNGSTEGGVRKLQAMLHRVEAAMRGAKRGQNTHADKHLPA